jgi:murein DD-endopeptidase MepM/ murein hydrolase activator NlpD
MEGSTENGLSTLVFALPDAMRRPSTWMDKPFSDRYKCSGALFIIPHLGNMGWPYMDPGQDVKNIDGTIHRGIDIFGRTDDPVYAPYDGFVAHGTPYFRLYHPSLGIYTYYGHINSSLSQGTPVFQGDQIGNLQDLGSNTHLHFVALKQNTSELEFDNH